RFRFNKRTVVRKSSRRVESAPLSKCARRPSGPRTLSMKHSKQMQVVFGVHAKLLALLAFAVIANTGAIGQQQSGPYPTLVIRGVTVIDGSGAPAFGPADIFVQGNRITRVAPTDAITREEEKAEAAGTKRAAPDRVIDGKGMYVMPGIVDLHAHINFNKD